MERPGESSGQAGGPAGPGLVRSYLLEIIPIRGPVAEILRKNPGWSLEVRIRGDKTLGDLRRAICDLLGSWSDPAFRSQFGVGAAAPDESGCVQPPGGEVAREGADPQAGGVDLTPVDSLGLVAGHRFAFRAGSGDDMTVEIDVVAVKVRAPGAGRPLRKKRVGDGPPRGTAEGR